MLSAGQIRTSERRRIAHVLRGWMILWLLALPLFHIHPETDPHHGEAGHVHAAAVHTVFSGDLEGEFGEHQETASVRPHPGEGPAVSAEGGYQPLSLARRLYNCSTLPRQSRAEVQLLPRPPYDL